ncbi:MAG: AFG1 family ATPase [Marinomonas atlantica]|nr:AFG1 family ATPase [Marinomonas atlantica]
MNDQPFASPSSLYLDLLAQGKIEDDPAQANALHALDALWCQLISKDGISDGHLGVYLWGDVGRGKTMLMDLFFQSLPEGMAKRQHFHHFMTDLHRELNTTFGVSNPLDRIAARVAKEFKVICFDEFFVSDIADAMLLGNFVQALFKEGCSLVATSNIAVIDLFQNQLQKDRFFPAIETLDQHLHSFHLTGSVDHRFRLPIDQATYFTDKESFNLLISDVFSVSERQESDVTINHRKFPVLAKNAYAIWCDFNSLCESPRSAHDYITLAQQYERIYVSSIPELSSSPYEHIKARGTEDGAVGSGHTGDREVVHGLNDDAVRRFISLIDECYDQRINMVFQAEVTLDKLYTNGVLLFEFQRTFSRMTEMQTKGYLDLSI